MLSLKNRSLLFLLVVLFIFVSSCQTNRDEVMALGKKTIMPDITGKDVTLLYSDDFSRQSFQSSLAPRAVYPHVNLDAFTEPSTPQYGMRQYGEESRYCWCWSSSNCSCPQHIGFNVRSIPFTPSSRLYKNPNALSPSIN